MRIELTSDQLLFTTVLIESYFGDERLSGTGFFRFRKIHGSKGLEFLVTNRHLVEGALKTSIVFHARGADGKPEIGKIHTFIIEPSAKAWISSPDAHVDIAILPLQRIMDKLEEHGGVFFLNVDDPVIPSADQLDDALVIEDVIFPGYPNRLFDRKNYLPIIRKGTTATPIQVDYNGEPIFLISASVFPGSSGSPVFIHDAGFYYARSGMSYKGRLWFLGVLARFEYREAPGWFEYKDSAVLEAKVATQETLDLGIVFKDKAILATIDHYLAMSGIQRGE